MKPGLLFLCHRLPFPPDKGDKIRSYHMLQFLASRYRVFLGAFVDDEYDWIHAEDLRCLCEEAQLVRLVPSRAKLRSLRGLLDGRALTFPYYASAQMDSWARRVVEREGLKRALAFSSPMAQYLMKADFARLCRVVDFVDVDSAKWTQYAERKAFPMSWIYRREGRRLFEYEREVARAFDRTFFVSEAEARMFCSLAPEVADRVDYFVNGVDTASFSPSLDLPSPYADGERALVFVGAMDYWPNVDAVEWFADHVLGDLRASHPEVSFHIVGRNPSNAVKRLAERPGVVVTGAVEDVRPYVLHASVSVAPLQVARGVQNKVLEAMALAKAVVASPAALEGLDARTDEEILIGKTPKEFQIQVKRVLETGGTAIGQRARRRVLESYAWESHLPRLLGALEALV